MFVITIACDQLAGIFSGLLNVSCDICDVVGCECKNIYTNNFRISKLSHFQVFDPALGANNGLVLQSYAFNFH